MASGSFGNGSGQNCRLGINWSSSKGNSGSTVNATLIAQNQNNWYFSAYVYGGYGVTINGNQKTGSGAQLSGSVNGAVGLISHSVWVAYTGDKTINISGYANFNGIINLSNQTISGNVKLDNVGTAPSMGSITSPTGNYVASETTTSLSVSWNAGNSYNNSGTYRVDVSINGGSWEWVSGDLGWNTRSYSYSLPNRSQGTTYQFRVCCGNNIGWSGHVYSAIVTLNYLNPPSIDSMPNPFNPYSSTSFTVGLSGGSQANGGSFMRKADIYMYNTAGNQVKWYCSKPSYGNTSITVGVSQTDVINALGTGRYSAKIYAIAWIENSNGSRSGYVIKESTVNINTDGGATPTLGAPTISGGAFGYPSTCFASGISTVKVASASAGLRRAPSGTSISYKIACTGVNTQNSSSASFSNLSAGLKTITVTATDSRGLSTSVEKQIRIQPYNVPTIRNYSALRLDNPQTSAKLTYTLAYSEIYAYDKGIDAKGTQLNNINSQQYSTNNSTWNNSSNGITVTGLSTESVYTIYLRIADKLQTGTYTTESYIVPTIKTNVAIRKHGVGLNCVPQSDYALDVSGNSRISGSLQASGNLYITSKGVAIGKVVEKDAFEINTDVYCYGDINGKRVKSGSVMRYGANFNVFNGSKLWVKLGTWDSYGDSNSCKITVLTGNGYNAAPTQNTEIEIFIKDSWQSSASTTGAFGGTFAVKYNYDYSISVWVLAQSDHVCDVWVRLPYAYGNGHYLFEGNGYWTHSTETRPFDSDPTSGVGQSVKEMTADFKGYPVGSIYLSWDNTNPQSFMGGTWVRMAEGRGLFGIGYSTGKDGYNGQVGEHEEFGSWKHTITTDEMPSHSHNLAHMEAVREAGGYGLTTGAVGFVDRAIVQGDYYNSKRYSTTTATGSGNSFYTVSPYIGIYVWRRTA